jgi:hypothetical protein
LCRCAAEAEVQRFGRVAELQRYGGADVQRCRDAEVQRWCRGGAEVQRCTCKEEKMCGAEVQRWYRDHAWVKGSEEQE